MFKCDKCNRYYVSVKDLFSHKDPPLSNLELNNRQAMSNHIDTPATKNLLPASTKSYDYTYGNSQVSNNDWAKYPYTSSSCSSYKYTPPAKRFCAFLTRKGRKYIAKIISELTPEEWAKKHNYEMVRWLSIDRKWIEKKIEKTEIIQVK